MTEPVAARVTLGYSTTADRVRNVAPPPEDPLLAVIVSVQNPSETDWRSTLPESLTARGDVTFFEQVAWGVAKSRNLVLDAAETEYLLFADDDVEFDWPGILEGLALLDADPGAGMLLAAARDEHGRLRKDYPASVVPLTLRNSGKAATYEMLVRVPDVRARGIRFDERFGAGAENYLGDEYIFCADLLKAGGRGLHGPVVVAMHPDDSSGSRWGTDADRRARAVIFDRVFGWKAPAVRLAFGLRRRAELGGVGGALRFTLGR
ncbi:glycosyltransferase family 2 protein [Longivirga aurantiaca]|uniref:Glycosyltransferase family 2 protein n=1 Tax=Longivirga aurantiaca TaxID=1837743 RepID=A0ABW1T2N2_9ACTN